MRPYLSCLVVLFLVAFKSGESAEIATIHGELSCYACNSYTDVVVEVQDSNRNPVGRYSVNHTGNFEVYGVAEGNYIVAVKGANGNEIVSQQVTLRSQSPPLSIRMPDPSSERPGNARDGSVSVFQLVHKVPKAAKKEFEKSAKAGDDHPRVIRHLEKAIEIDPQYVEALNNLGSRYLQTGRIQSAMDVLERAQSLDPASAKVQTNLAVALLTVQKLDDAERAARRAVQLASNDPKARYILALSLYQKQKFTTETVSLLRSSQELFPNANIALASIFAIQGRKQEARRFLDTYLSSGRTERIHQVRQMLAALQ